jgi:hypothetical protein
VQTVHKSNLYIIGLLVMFMMSFTVYHAVYEHACYQFKIIIFYALPSCLVNKDLYICSSSSLATACADKFSAQQFSKKLRHIRESNFEV